jgi:hypothetical protein
MSITPSELRWYKSQTVSDSSANGGRMSTVESPSGVKNNIFPDVSLAERTAGIVRLRKLFLKVANDDDLTLFNGRVFMQLNTPGDDNVTFFPGNQRGTQASVTGSERLYGGGRLNANVSAGALTFVVATEGAALNYLRTGDVIRITDKTSVGGSGNEEFVTASNVTWAGDLATVTIPSPGLANGYTASNTGVSSVYEAGDVKTNVTAPAITSATGTADFVANPILGDNIATIEQDWTLTFTSSTAYTIVGDVVGSVGSGNISSDATPGNPNFSGKPYFTIPSAAWGGTWAPGDTVTFTTSPAAIPVWYRQAVPAGASALSGDRVIIGLSGESA